MVKDREAWHVGVNGVAKSRTQMSDWTELITLSKDIKKQAETGESRISWGHINLASSNQQ